MTNTLWKSPITSQEITDGPQAVLQPGQLVIRFESEDRTCYEVRFEAVLKFTFTEFGACSAEHVDAYDKLLDLGENSSFAREAKKEARGDVDRYRHFRVFFDDVGAYDIIARSVEWS